MKKRFWVTAVKDGEQASWHIFNSNHAYPVASHAYLLCNLSGCLPQRPVPY